MPSSYRYSSIRADQVARRVGPERPHARRAGPGPRGAWVSGPLVRRLWRQSLYLLAAAAIRAA